MIPEVSHTLRQNRLPLTDKKIRREEKKTQKKQDKKLRKEVLKKETETAVEEEL